MNVLNMHKLNYPGLIYNEYRDTAEMIYGDVLISVFINSDTDELDVTADTVDNKGDFAKNIEWITCSPKDSWGEDTGIVDDGAYNNAIQAIRKLVKDEYNRRNKDKRR